MGAGGADQIAERWKDEADQRYALCHLVQMLGFSGEHPLVPSQQPSEHDQIAVSRHLICTGARQNPVVQIKAIEKDGLIPLKGADNRFRSRRGGANQRDALRHLVYSLGLSVDCPLDLNQGIVNRRDPDGLLIALAHPLCKCCAFEVLFNRWSMRGSPPLNFRVLRDRNCTTQGPKLICGVQVDV